MAHNSYQQNDKPRITATFTQSGNLVNPSGVFIQIKKPDNTFISYISSSGFSTQGAWDASANTPALVNGTGTVGNHYTVSVAGTVDFGDGPIAFTTSDLVYYNGDTWNKIVAPESTSLTNSSTGVFYIEILASQAGIWVFEVEGIGNGQSAAESNFHVSAPTVQ
jgi:hypothetical protein